MTFLKLTIFLNGARRVFHGRSERTINTRIYGSKYFAANTIAKPLFIYAAISWFLSSFHLTANDAQEKNRTLLQENVRLEHFKPSSLGVEWLECSWRVTANAAAVEHVSRISDCAAPIEAGCVASISATNVSRKMFRFSLEEVVVGGVGNDGAVSILFDAHSSGRLEDER